MHIEPIEFHKLNYIGLLKKRPSAGLILTISPTICILLVCHLDDIINIAFQETKNNNKIIFVLDYITQKRSIIKMIKVKFKMIKYV